MINALDYGVLPSRDASDNINQALQGAAKTGDAISLPPGRLVAAGINLSAGANGLERHTPVTIEGAGMTTVRAEMNEAAGTVIDARELSDHVFKILNSKFSVTIRNMSIIVNGGGFDGLHFDPGTNGVIGNLTLENVMVYGASGYGFYLRNTYGDVWLNKLYARACRRGFYGELWNAVSAGILTARECQELAFEINGGSGFDIKNLYLESNAAEALRVHGTCYASRIGAVYAENNNTEGAAAYTVKLGEGIEASSGLKAMSVGPLVIGPQDNAPSDAYLLLARYRGLEIAGLNSPGANATAPLVRVSDAPGYAYSLLLKNIVTNLDIDTSNAPDGGVTYQNCYIT